jgi:protein TonB
VKTAQAVAKKPAPATEVAQEAATETKPRWTPMALAPADKDTVAKPKLTPKRAETASSYNAEIWSALARHKPRAGKAGSAAVTFSIGAAGGLRSARISGSSGDSQLDQMALQTVRNAAPFPPPPNPASASYTIRIYFR